MAVIGGVFICLILWDAFEAMVLPRRVTRRLRPTRFFYRFTWTLWSGAAGWMRASGRRETYLSFYGPLSLLLLLVMWASSLVVGFATLQWALGPDLTAPEGHPGFGTVLYMSGTTFFTLGVGDVAPVGRLARFLTVVESGIGFGFLALVIGYLPVLYQSFSRREVNITLLDARAGSPPTAAELLRRHGADLGELTDLLRDWERWAAEFLEAHLSYPVLSYFRSQHDNQSGLAALTAILDASALVVAGVEGACARQAELTFAIARHAVIDLAQVFRIRPSPVRTNRLPREELARLRATLAARGFILKGDEAADRQLGLLRDMYEPHVNALSVHLLMPLPVWLPRSPEHNWRTTAWE